MILTDQQARFYNTFGYLIFHQLFGTAEVAEFSSAFDTAMKEHGEDVEEDGQLRRHLDAPIEHSKSMCALLDDERVISIAATLLGKDFNYAGGDGTVDAGDTRWHIDGNWGEHFAAKMIFFLDPVRSDSGCLRIVPGSHRPDHHIRAYRLDPNRSEQQFGINPREFPGNVPLVADPGDLIIFNHDMYHALYGGSQHRREFTINLTKRCHNQVDLMTLREYLRINVGNRPWGSMYTRTMMETASEARKSHLTQVSDLYEQLSRTPGAI